jgi:hypothetical protein
VEESGEIRGVSTLLHSSLGKFARGGAKSENETEQEEEQLQQMRICAFHSLSLSLSLALSLSLSSSLSFLATLLFSDFVPFSLIH